MLTDWWSAVKFCIPHQESRIRNKPMCADIVPGKAQAGRRLPAAAFKAEVESRAGKAVLLAAPPTSSPGRGVTSRRGVSSAWRSLPRRSNFASVIRHASRASTSPRATEKPFVRSGTTAFVRRACPRTAGKSGMTSLAHAELVFPSIVVYFRTV